jgi:KUP system potassium uptake protein
MKDLSKKSTDFGWLGLIISLGIVYGDLGTSPLYTMSAITRGTPNPSTDFILGALSCVFWTLTLQTTLKYIIITLRANNHGEGGILLLLTLLKNRKRWIYSIAIIGACALLGDGIITPAVTVTSAVEGIQHYFPHINIPLWVVVILSLLFMAQQFGTASLGKAFGPIMLLWFTMMGIMGIRGILEFPAIFSAINPMYAIRLIMHTPHVLVLLGAVFLCTTGAEALYSDLGHCGSKNIQVSWIFVKASLILNYFGQGAWILSKSWTGSNPFFDIMPQWFLPFGILLATLAAIIASQALITGSYTIVSEAVSLRLFPKIFR